MKINYANYDFEDLVKQLQEHLKEKDGAWKDLQTSSTGTVIIELFAYVANLVLYYLERRSEELYIDTAKNRSSILNLVRLLNYTPHRVVGASGELKFHLGKDSNGQNIQAKHTIQIPKYTRCRDSRGKTYATVKTVEIGLHKTSATVAAVQGTVNSQRYISTGRAPQSIKIPYTNVADTALYDTLQVSGNGDVYERRESFYDSGPTDRHYRIAHNHDDTLTIVFGNGMRGRNPDVGEVITVKYLLSDGVVGNQFELNSINLLVDKIDGADLLVENTTAFSGGAGAETTEHIKHFAPRIFATGQRAVIREDFITILRHYSGVLSANAWGEYEVMEMQGGEEAAEMRNIVRFSVVQQHSETDWGVPNPNDVVSLKAALRKQAILTIKYEYEPAEIIEIVPFLHLTITEGANLDFIKDEAEKIVKEQFVPGSTIELGREVRYSDIICNLNQIDGVAYLNMALRIRQDVSLDGGGLEHAATLPLLAVKRRSVRVYADGVLMAVDDGSGTAELIEFTDDTPQVLSGFTIDYDTGVIVITAETAAEISNMYILYEQDTTGDIELAFNQICRYNSEHGIDYKTDVYIDRGN